MMYSKNRESPKSEDSEPTSSPQLISLKPIMDFGDTLQLSIFTEIVIQY
jgi:hypothetical protein